MVRLCTALSSLHCVIGYTYVLIEKETIKSAKWNIELCQNVYATL
jgi:hypothetical protein